MNSPKCEFPRIKWKLILKWKIVIGLENFVSKTFTCLHMHNLFLYKPKWYRNQTKLTPYVLVVNLQINPLIIKKNHVTFHITWCYSWCISHCFFFHVMYVTSHHNAKWFDEMSSHMNQLVWFFFTFNFFWFLYHYSITYRVNITYRFEKKKKKKKKKNDW